MYSQISQMDFIKMIWLITVMKTSAIQQNIRQRYLLALPTVSSFICKVDIDIVSKRGSVTLLLLQLCDTDSQTKLEFNVNPVSFGCHSERKSNTVGFSLWMKLAHMCVSKALRKNAESWCTDKHAFQQKKIDMRGSNRSFKYASNMQFCNFFSEQDSKSRIPSVYNQIESSYHW